MVGFPVQGAMMPAPGGIYTLSQTFASTFNGGMQSFTVPAGVTSVVAHCYGGGGGTKFLADGGGDYVLKGGFGAGAAKTIAVTPGEILYISVGSISDEESGDSGRAASSVRQGGAALSNRVVVGGAGGFAGTGRGEHGPNAGFPNGEDGGNTIDHGKAGTQSAGGRGGVTADSTSIPTSVRNGQDGSLGHGGTGVRDGFYSVDGGHGGGGYYGGGGGAGTQQSRGVAGGSGSSLGDFGVAGARDGAGFVTIYYPASPIPGVATLTATSTLTAAGKGTAVAQAPLVASAALSASGSQASQGATAMAATAVLTAVPPDATTVNTYTFAAQGPNEFVFVVPPDVFSVEFELHGGDGANAPLSTGGYGARGGYGGYLKAKVATTPGETLYIFPGENGQGTQLGSYRDRYGPIQDQIMPADGGRCGVLTDSQRPSQSRSYDSSGGRGALRNSSFGGGGGGGGGDVRRGGRTLADRILAVGGGGGKQTQRPAGDPQGGNSGYPTGQDGYTAGPATTAGAGGASGPPALPPVFPSTQNGALGKGGAGQNDTGDSSTANCEGGAGGGGYYGGGGGGGDAATAQAGEGGGGSIYYATVGITNVVTGVNSTRSSPRIVATYTPTLTAAGTAPLSATSSLSTSGTSIPVKQATAALVATSAFTNAAAVFRTSKLPPDNILQQVNLTGDLPTIQDDPDAPDANYMSGTGAVQLRVSFPQIPGTLRSGAGLQIFRIRARPGS